MAALKDQERVALSEADAAEAEIAFFQAELNDLRAESDKGGASNAEADAWLKKWVDAEKKLRQAEAKLAAAKRNALAARKDMMALAAENARKQAQENRERREKETKSELNASPEWKPKP